MNLVLNWLSFGAVALGLSGAFLVCLQLRRWYELPFVSGMELLEGLMLAGKFVKL